MGLQDRDTPFGQTSIVRWCPSVYLAQVAGRLGTDSVPLSEVDLQYSLSSARGAAALLLRRGLSEYEAGDP